MDVGDGMLFSANVVDGLVHQLGGSELALECQKIGDSAELHSNASFFQATQDILQQIMSMADKWVRVHDKSHLDTFVRCPEGDAVSTSPGSRSSKLARQYDEIIHTVAPFFNAASSAEIQDLSYREDDVVNDNDKHDPERILRQCYTNSMDIATNSLKLRNQQNGKGAPSVRVASPLLGAGCKGFPKDVAILVAASSAAEWLHGHEDITSASSATADITLAFGIPEPTTAKLLVEALQDEIKETLADN